MIEVVLVEDDPNDVKLFHHAVAAHGLARASVAVARDGADALLVLLGPDAELPRLVLLDVKLPKVDGHEVLQQLRAEPATAHLPVVMLSSSREPRDIALAYALGASAYVVKDVEYRAYSATLTRTIGFWLGVNVLCPQAPAVTA